MTIELGYMLATLLILVRLLLICLSAEVRTRARRCGRRYIISLTTNIVCL